MVSLLLAIIYIAFISLGLPDSLLGSAWPIMHEELRVPMSFAGIVSMIIAFGTIVSSLLSDRFTRRFGTGVVTAASVLATAVALFGFAYSGSFLLLCLFAIPYGLGAGGVDAALNNYVALHYKSRHMSWLHSFWGIGASISPYIMGYYLTGGHGWQNGYQAVGLIQIALTAVLFISLPMWDRKEKEVDSPVRGEPLSIRDALNIRGVKYILITFFCYSAIESTTGLWASSYLVQHRSIDVETAARFASLFFIGITTGRFLSGFISEKVGDKRLIRYGILVILLGITMVALPLNRDGIALAGLIITGLGCAPVYPAIIHSTPANFGTEHSHAIIGIQMASAYVGSTFMPPLFGIIGGEINIGIFPFFLLGFGILILFMSEMLNRTLSTRDHEVVS